MNSLVEKREESELKVLEKPELYKARDIMWVIICENSLAVAQVELQEGSSLPKEKV